MSGADRLFKPITVGNVELKNRLVMLAMTVGLAENHNVTDHFVNYHAERARGGVGLLIIGGLVPTEFAGTKPAYGGTAISPSICDDKFIPPLRKLTTAIHDGGAKVAAQLLLHYEWRKDRNAPVESVGPSDGPGGPGLPSLRALTVDEIHRIIEEFGEAARRAREAGFDMVELQAGIGYFLNRFLSSYSNRRTDEYGGSIENRARLLVEITDRARRKAGSDYTIICRVSAEEFMEGGNTVEDTKKIAPLLEKAGIAAIDVEAGWHESRRPLVQQWVPPAAFVHFAEQVKSVVNIPVIAGMRISDPLLADRILAEGKADMIGMGRALIADPELPNKARGGRFDEIRRCISCCRCLDNTIVGKPVTCTVYARVGREMDYPIEGPAAQPKKVLVIGSGPAGMEAARVAASRGHKVTLCEKSGRLGGLMLLGAVLNKELEPFVKYLSTQVKRLPVELKMRTEITPASLDVIKPDVVVLAAGGIPIVPEVPGVTKDIVLSNHDMMGIMNGIPPKSSGIKLKLFWRLASAFARYVYRPSVMRRFLKSGFPIGKRVIIIGGQFAGLEVALALAEGGKEVTVIEESERIGSDIGVTTRWVERAMLKEAGARIETRARVTEITDRGVKLARDGQTMILEADTVVTAVGRGVTANAELAREMKARVPVLYSIGDCAEPGRIKEAIASGFEIGHRI
ncbi:MAG: FAD-dependent oxidoreductase [Chloroflexota bacterium]